MLLSGFKTKAIIIDWHLDAAELKLRHTETPQIASASGVRVKLKAVRVKLKAVGVNPLDTELAFRLYQTDDKVESDPWSQLRAWLENPETWRSGS